MKQTQNEKNLDEQEIFQLDEGERDSQEAIDSVDAERVVSEPNKRRQCSVSEWFENPKFPKTYKTAATASMISC